MCHPLPIHRWDRAPLFTYTLVELSYLADSYTIYLYICRTESLLTYTLVGLSHPLPEHL